MHGTGTKVEADGRRFDVEYSGGPLPSEEGSFSGLDWLILDLTGLS